jgi:hypothetical protein
VFVVNFVVCGLSENAAPEGAINFWGTWAARLKPRPFKAIS